jgi:hypothetical protein
MHPFARDCLFAASAWSASYVLWLQALWLPITSERYKCWSSCADAMHGGALATWCVLVVEEDVLCVWTWMCCAGSMMAEAGVYPCAAVAVQLE